MAVYHRETSHVHLPADFGLGLAVTTVIGGLLLLGLAAVHSVPTQGPRGESKQPDPASTYVDIAPPTPAASSSSLP
jgi:hypothetical protein